MSERKVLNKYYPPDFDPRLLPRNKRAENRLVKVRTMLPFTLQCLGCSDYIHAGKKFNSRKELVEGETYLGIKIWRFYINCPTCASEITFRTDPKNSDYLCERGATRNFEKWRNEAAEEEEEKKVKADEEEADAMKALESRQEESKREMEMLDRLEELKELRDRHGAVSNDQLFDLLHKRHGKKTTRFAADDDEKLVQVAFGSIEDENGAVEKRLNDSDEEVFGIETVPRSIFASIETRKLADSTASTARTGLKRVQVMSIGKPKKAKLSSSAERDKRRSRQGSSHSNNLPAHPSASSALITLAGYASSNSD